LPNQDGQRYPANKVYISAAHTGTTVFTKMEYIALWMYVSHSARNFSEQRFVQGKRFS
jgi:hypothetical protein